MKLTNGFVPTVSSSNLLSFTLLFTTYIFANATDVSSAISRRLSEDVLNYGDKINLKNNFVDARWLSGARSSANNDVKTMDPNSGNEQDSIGTYQWTVMRGASTIGSGCVEYGGTVYLKNNYVEDRWLTGGRNRGNEGVFTRDYYEGTEAGPSYEWIIEQTPGITGSGCVKPNDIIYLKVASRSASWLTGARNGQGTSGSHRVLTRNYNRPSHDYFERNGASASYQWTVQIDTSATAAPTSVTAFYTKKYTSRWPNCDNIQCFYAHSKSVDEMEEECNSYSACSGFSFTNGGTLGDGCLKSCGIDEGAKGYGHGSHDYYEKPTTMAPTPRGSCYNIEETYYAADHGWCYKVETGKGINLFTQRYISSDCEAKFAENGGPEYHIGDASNGEYQFTHGDICNGNLPREGELIILEEDRSDIAAEAQSYMKGDVCFYEVTVRRPPCHTATPTLAPTVAATPVPTVAATPEITADQGNTRTISAQGDPIILGLKGQVFKFDGRDGGWYANIASKSFNWNMQFKEYPTCKKGSDVFISGMSLLTSEKESDILIATTPYQIEECRGHDKNCLGDGTLHISFDGGKSYVSNPGDYHYAANNRVVAHNTYGACSRRWYDYDITSKQSKFSRLGGRRATVEEKKPFELLTEKAETMINPGECLEWIGERKIKGDLFEQKGLWSTVHVQTPSVSFHIEYRQSNPEKSDKECDFQSLDAWMVTVSKDLEEQTWEGVLGETKEKIFDKTGHQVLSDRNVILRGKEDADYEVDGPFGTTFNAQKKMSILPW